MTEAPRLAVLRADASAAIGFGHVARSLTLGEELRRRGWACALATRRPIASLRDRLARSGIDLVTVDDAVALGDEPDAIAAGIGAGHAHSTALVLTDHYDIGADWHRRASWASVVAAIDDLADRPQAVDVLINQNLGAAADRYAGLVPADATLLLGPTHALVRPAFAEERGRGLRDRRELRRVLVLLGGADQPNVTLRAAVAAASLGLVVDVVVGPLYGHVSKLEGWAAATPRVEVHVDTPDVARLMAAADVCIGAPGSASWERCTLGLPALLAILAQNQVEVSELLVKAGAAVGLGWHADIRERHIAAALEDLRARPGALDRMATAAAAITDGRGVIRVADAIERRVSTQRGEQQR